MAATVTFTESYDLASGERFCRGTITLGDVYLTDGVVADLSAKLSGTPTVVIGQQNDTYTLSHDGGTAAAGKMQAVVIANGAEVANAFNTYNVTCSFIAVGTAV